MARGVRNIYQKRPLNHFSSSPLGEDIYKGKLESCRTHHSSLSRLLLALLDLRELQYVHHCEDLH